MASASAQTTAGETSRRPLSGGVTAVFIASCSDRMRCIFFSATHGLKPSAHNFIQQPFFYQFPLASANRSWLRVWLCFSGSSGRLAPRVSGPCRAAEGPRSCDSRVERGFAGFRGDRGAIVTCFSSWSTKDHALLQPCLQRALLDRWIHPCTHQNTATARAPVPGREMFLVDGFPPEE